MKKPAIAGFSEGENRAESSVQLERGPGCFGKHVFGK